MEAETDATKGQESKQQIRDEELFKAAESGDSSVFMSLSPQQLAKSLSFRNEDVSEIYYWNINGVEPKNVNCSRSLPRPCLSFVRSFSGKKSDIKIVWLWDLQIVKLLSSVDESKTVINSKDDEVWAPLHSATSIGKAGLVEILLTRGLCCNLVSFL
ncbi:hypothetical protein F2Q69_00017178 [Brassica cretica]|uniref:Uncharacterized protein n=1 Tax=Brassica cretica TaxID=69181 RepID=A0A8S9R8V4_BRACR|nr:hypothetical protein F2Q69_00017178 [Brassica cretica]